MSSDKSRRSGYPLMAARSPGYLQLFALRSVPTVFDGLCWRDLALRLSRLFGNSPEFWLNAQRAIDLWDAAKEIGPEVKRIKPLNVA